MAFVLRNLDVNGESVDLTVIDGKVVFGAPEPTDRFRDASQFIISPGFVDLQINGSFGHDFVNNPGSIWDVARQLPNFGVTEFLPTLVTCPEQKVEEAIAVLRAGPPPGFLGAKVLGLHLEGPFLNAKRKGAHQEAWLREPCTPLSWIDAPEILMVTLAPELAGCLPLIADCVAHGLLVAAGHSEADASTLKTAANLGLRYGTHLFNAMSGLHHRRPGLAAALLDDERLTCGLIADGIHVDDALMRLAWRIKGNRRLNLVSDAVAAAGMPDGSYEFAGVTVQVEADTVRLADGTLAGSALTLDAALRRFVTVVDCDLRMALPLVTDVPRGLLGIEKPKVEAKPTDAFVVLDEKGHIVAHHLPQMLA